MKVLWAFLCRSSSIDAETNNISLFNILEDIQVPSNPPTQADDSSRPLAMGSFELIVATTRDNSQAGELIRTRVRLHFPDESPPETLAELDIDLVSAERSRFRLGMPGLPIGGLGTYRFAIEVPSDENGSWREIGNAPLDLSYHPQEVG